MFERIGSDPLRWYLVSSPLMKGGDARIDQEGKAIAESVRTICVGAGSVTSALKAKKAIDAGAQFLVSPGLDDGVVAAALARRVPLIPGVFTPTELMRAATAGYDIVKLFPAEPGGGVATVKALAAVWPEVGFVPTGGITAENAPGYLAEPQVVAVGGSWMATRHTIAANDWETITALTAEALQLGSTDRAPDA